MVFSSLAFAQIAPPERESAMTSSTSTATGTTTPNPQKKCCVNDIQGTNGCQIKFVTGNCPGNWRHETDIKACFKSTGLAVSGINLNQAYPITPCPF